MSFGRQIISSEFGTPYNPMDPWSRSRKTYDVDAGQMNLCSLGNIRILLMEIDIIVCIDLDGVSSAFDCLI